MKKWLALSLFCLTGCGAELERSSEVETLRVLGVHKTKSYAQAGDEVTFSMLWHDPKGRDITPVWFAAEEAQFALLAQAIQNDCNPFAGAGDPDACPDEADSRDGASPWDPTDRLMPLCANPPRDTYYGCLLAHGGLFEAGLMPLISHPGNSITLTVPTSTVDVQEGGAELKVPSLKACAPDDKSCASIYHEAPDSNDLPNFGSMFAFFALCPGELGYRDVSEGFGITCRDADGELFGPSDFVFGYSQIFLYQDLQNKNPVVDGMVVDGEEAKACIGVDCLDDTGERPETCGDGVPCLKVCTKSDEDDCPEISIKPLIPKVYPCGDSDDGECDNAEKDEVAEIAYGRSNLEQMWIRYYTDQGRMDSEVKLLNDATTGWNGEYGTKLRLPQEPGPLRLWAVVYDNRGGQNWVRVDAVVEE